MDPEVLFSLSYGMYVVCSKNGDKFNGQIANTVFQVVSEPPTVAVSINKHNLTGEYISISKVFTVSVLSIETPMIFIGRFGFRSGRDVNKFEELNYIIGKTGAPIVTDNCLSYLECEVVNFLDVGTHVLYIGKIVEAEKIRDGESMTYAYYHLIKGGKSPKTAPTFVKG